MRPLIQLNHRQLFLNKLSSFWNPPWGWITSFFIQLSLILIGLPLNFYSRPSIPGWPYNGYLLFIYFVFITVLYLIRRRCYPVEWLLSLPGAISSIVSFIIMILIFGLESSSQVFHTWPFIFSWLMMTSSLFLALIKNSLSSFLSLENLAFTSNHLGLLIIILTMTFGSGDYKSYQMILHEGSVVWEGELKGIPHPIPLPFALKLHKFNMEEYPPKMIFFNPKDGSVVDDKIWNITILNNMPSAALVSSNTEPVKFIPVYDVGAVVATQIEVLNSQTKKSIKGWISTASLRFNAQTLDLAQGLALGYLPPRPKSFESVISLYTPEGEKFENISLKVNQPYHFVKESSWTFYQAGYDDRMGKWSRTSTIEAIYDPWIKYIWLGVIILFCGTMLLLFRYND